MSPWRRIKSHPLAGSGITERDAHAGYMQNWNFDIQRDLGHAFALDVAYAGGTLEFVVPFDASTLTGTNVPLYTAIAIANLDPNNSANASCIARDSQGVTIPNAVSVPTLNPRGHWSDYLFPALTGKRGTIDCRANTAISAIAFRFIGTTNSIFSSLPVVSK